MKELRSTNEVRVQRIEGYTGAPNFVIDNVLYFTYELGEKYLTMGEMGAHHTLKATVISSLDEYTHYTLYVDYHKNTFTLTPLEEV